MRRLLVAVLAPALACSPQSESVLTPASYIEKLRVLAIRAEPPILRSGESARVDALVVDINDAPVSANYAWISCDPPDGTYNGCNVEEIQYDPIRALSGDVPGVRVSLGAREFAYQAPDHANGDAVVILLAYEGDDPQAAWESSHASLAFKRVTVSGSDRPRHANPAIESISVDGRTVAPGASMEGAVGRNVELRGKASASAEALTFTWYTTNGAFVWPTNLPVHSNAGDPVTLTFSTSGIPTRVFAVLHDGHGGVDWIRVGLNQ